MVLSHDVFYWISDNIFFAIQIFLMFFVPLFILFKLYKLISYKYKNVIKLNNILIDRYSYNEFCRQAQRSNEPVKKRISAVLNSYHQVNNRYWR